MTDHGGQADKISRRRLLGQGLKGSFVVTLAGGAGVGVLAGTRPAQAQDWLNRGLEVLEQLGGGGSGGASLSTSEVVLGLQEALRVGTERTITRVGRPGGYSLDNIIRIPLPGSLARIQSALQPLGMSGTLDDLESRLNRAAETAAPFAKDLFFNAIEAMTIQDALGILQGSDTAATQYFQGAMTPKLKTTFSPIIDQELEEAGAFTQLARTADTVSGLPIGDRVSSNAKQELSDHGLDFALNGLFHYLGKEEAAIRNNPVKRSSEILRRVFGA